METETILLWHGTNPKNLKAILKSGKFKNGTFFTADEAEARRYAGMACTSRMKPYAMNVNIKKEDLYFNGFYYIAKGELIYKDSMYQILTK